MPYSPDDPMLQQRLEVEAAIDSTPIPQDLTSIISAAERANAHARDMVESTTPFNLDELPLELSMRLALWCVDLHAWEARQ